MYLGMCMGSGGGRVGELSGSLEGRRLRGGEELAAGGVRTLAETAGSVRRRPRQSPAQPAVSEGLRRGHSRGGVPLEAALEEIEEERIVASLQSSAQLLAVRRASVFTSSRAAPSKGYGAVGVQGGRAVSRVALGAKERPASLAAFQHLGRGHSEHFHHARQLVAFVFSGEQGIPGEQLGQDAAKAPHVYGHAVFRSEDHLWRSVESTLDVRVDALVLIAAGAVVDHLDSASAGLFQEDVLRFEVAVNDSIPVEGVEALENGVGEFPHQGEAEPLELVLLDQLVEVHAQQLEGEADVVSEGEMVDQMDDVVCVVLVLLPQVLQYPNLLVGLAVESLLVPYHLQSNVLLRSVIVRLQHLPETALSEDLEDLVAIGDVVVGDHLIRPSVVVIATVVRSTGETLSLLGVLTDEVDLGIGENLLVLIGTQPGTVQLHRLFWCEVFRFVNRGCSCSARIGSNYTGGPGGCQGPVYDRR